MKTLYLVLTLVLCSFSLPNCYGSERSPRIISDYIIIGGGAAGIRVAQSILEEKPNSKITILERGGEFHSDNTYSLKIQPGLQPLEYNNNRYVGNLFYEDSPFNYGNQLQVSNGFNNAYLAVARTTGGGSVLGKQKTWTRGDAVYYDNFWGPNWSFNDVLPFFRALENLTREDGNPINTTTHSTSGILKLLQMNAFGKAQWSPVIDSLMSTFGLYVTDDVNRGIDLANVIAEFQRAIGHSSSVYDVQDTFRHIFLPLMASNNNVCLLKETTAVLLELNNNLGRDASVRSVKALYQGEMYRLRASKKVIVATHPTDAVKLLELSGIGNKTYLESIGINSVIDLPAVGTKVTDRYFLRTTYSPTNSLCKPLSGAIGALLKDTSSIGTDIEISIRNDGLGNTIPIAIFMQKKYPQDYGTIHVTTSDPLRDPSVNYDLSQYGFARNDIDRIVRVVQLADQAVNNLNVSCSWTRTLPTLTQLPLGSSFATYKSVLSSMISASSWHVCGGLVLGEVVDPNTLHVYGVDNLVIAGAAVAPMNPNAHNNALTEMIGYRVGKIITQ